MASDEAGNLNNSNLDSVLEIENDLFYFETDQLALKGNQDYCDVLKTLVILTAQREKALKDFKTVAEMRREALLDPVEFLEKFKKEDSVGIKLPPVCEVAKLPVIDFTKYNTEIPKDDLTAIYAQSSNKDSNEEVNLKSKVTHRAWSPEEQKKLEELLIKYPPEPVEMKRFKKIAKELGNRTTAQVCSRVQKYFLKLYKAGLPIPGRIPKSSEKYRKSTLHKHQRHNHYLWKPTTFFPDLCVPVQMDESEDVPGPSMSSQNLPSTSTGPSNYLLNNDYHRASYVKPIKNEQEMQVKLLKRVREEKRKETEEGYTPFYHVGYRCDYCNEDPIVGSRWHCTSCDDDSIDFCTDCVLSQLFSDNCHPLHHDLINYEDDTERPMESKPYEEIPSDDVKKADDELETFLNQNEEFSKGLSDFEDVGEDFGEEFGD